MSEEGVAEKVYEAGIEIVNPGGRPDVVRDAARGWRAMSKHLDSMFSELDRQVENTLGDHWRGDSANAFKAHWHELKRAVDDTLPVFEEAAKGLDEAADAIEEINDEIHQIYLEIGVSVAAGVALSFVTMRCRPSRVRVSGSGSWWRWAPSTRADSHPEWAPASPAARGPNGGTTPSMPGTARWAARRREQPSVGVSEAGSPRARCPAASAGPERASWET
ncbi:WXG100 family type VII secretion target [Streptomyces sp. NPDC051684]|uniref:WXG100 family type VII secretion target n=1 Tax=Streptomyces sp. NPDC051684 TaxID=3365670 RepID=UPI00378A98FA